jgi:hypothetical protein
MKTRMIPVFVGLAFAVGMFAASSYAGDYICSGSCTLNGTFVDGNIKVQANATLRANGVRVIGNVQADNAAQVEVLSGSTVGGNIQIKQGGEARIDSVQIKGDLQFEENRGSLLANRNTIGGNLQAFKNTGGLSITKNTIYANLQCKENRPAPTGGENIVYENKEDQCANLSPSSTSTVTEDDLLGTWNTNSKARLNLRRLGSKSEQINSTMALNEDGTFTLIETDVTGTYNYTGHWSLIGGKKIVVDLDVAGQSEFMRMWTNWLKEIAAPRNVTVTDINFSEMKLTISQASISKGTRAPRKMTIKAQASLNARINGQDKVTRCSYVNRVSFLNR